MKKKIYTYIFRQKPYVLDLLALYLHPCVCVTENLFVSFGVVVEHANGPDRNPVYVYRYLLR